MRSLRTITVVGCHAGGEIGNVVVGGVLPPPGETVFEQMQHAADATATRFGDCSCASRAAASPVHANLVVPATRTDCDAGFIIMEPTEYPADVRLEHDLHGDGAARDRHGRDARAGDGRSGSRRRAASSRCARPAGTVAARASSSRTSPASPTGSMRRSRSTGSGTITVDVAYGGMWYAIADAARARLRDRAGRGA